MLAGNVVHFQRQANNGLCRAVGCWYDLPRMHPINHTMRSNTGSHSNTSHQSNYTRAKSNDARGIIELPIIRSNIAWDSLDGNRKKRLITRAGAQCSVKDDFSCKGKAQIFIRLLIRPQFYDRSTPNFDKFITLLRSVSVPNIMS